MLRSILLFLLCILQLNGCFLYSDLHSNAQPFNAIDLSEKHVYNIPKNPKPKLCIKQFKDKQLIQLIAVALTDSPNMGIAKARVQEARQLAKGAYSTLWPALDLSGYFQREKFPTYGLAPPPYNGRSFNIAELGLNFNYQIDFWGKNRENLASKISELYAQQAELTQVELMISSSVATVYFELIGNITQHQLAKENWRLQKQLSAIVLDRAKQGLESDIPLKTALGNVQTAQLSIEDFKRAEMLSRHKLAVLLGKNPLYTEIITPPQSALRQSVVLPKIIPANVLAQRPDIAASRALTEAAAHQINVAKANFFPNINLNALVSLQSVLLNKFFNIQSQNNSATGAIDLPLFDAGLRRANLSGKYAEYDVAVHNYNQTILTALQQVADELSTLQTLKVQITAESSALHTTQSNYKLFRARYNEGIIDYVQLIEVKQLLIQQKAVLSSLQIRQKQAIVALLTALGGEV